jgi:hypothetical protein
LFILNQQKMIMKIFSLLLLAVLSMSASYAQTVKKVNPVIKIKKTVTFQLDISGETKNVQSPSSIGLRGNTPPLAWDKTHPMTDKNHDGVYEATVTFNTINPNTVIEYKYFHDTLWETTGNRVATIKQTLTKLPVQKWNVAPVIEPSETAEELYKVIAHLDSALFSTIYTCNPGKNSTYFTDDLEFYHDKGGLMKTKQAFLDGLTNNYCKEDMRYTTRREVVPGTMKVWPVPNFGAIQTGEHWFYETEKGKEEKLVGIAKYAMIWQKKSGIWKVSR